MVQVFDVADRDNPSLLHRFLFGDEDSGSESLVDRHAFTYFDATGILALPFLQRNRDGFITESATALFHVDVDTGIELLGRVDQGAMGDREDGDEFSRAEALACNPVRRNVMISDAVEGTYNYAISGLGISISKVDDEVGAPLEVRFPTPVCDFGSPL